MSSPGGSSSPLRKTLIKPTHQNARQELVEILIDKSAGWRSQMLHNLGATLKHDMLYSDPDMFASVRKVLGFVFDNLWVDVEREVEKGISANVHVDIDFDEVPGPSGSCFLWLWFRIRAFVLYHYFPHNKTIYGKLRDPFYWIVLAISSLPQHGVRVVMYGIILFMLLWPGAPDEFALITFILLVKGFQFFTSGLLVMMRGTIAYYSCYTFHKADILECLDGEEGTGPGANNASGMVLDYLGNTALVWVAFAALLLCSENSVEAFQRDLTQEDETQQSNQKYHYRRMRLERAIKNESGKGGKVWHLLVWDMFCFACTVALLILMVFKTCDDHWESGGSWLSLNSSGQFRTSVYWCCNIYSLTTLPFAVYNIPCIMDVFTHSWWTGYNKHGACVMWAYRKVDDDPDKEEEVRETSRGKRAKRIIAKLGVKIVRTIERGQEAGGRATSDAMRFRDFARGLVASYWPGSGADADFTNKDPTLSDVPAHVEEVRIQKVQEGHPTYYFLEVMPVSATWEKATPWLRKHTFDDFSNLATQLGQECFFKDAPFPGRARFGKLTGHALEERRGALELWLRHVIRHKSAEEKWKAPLFHFLFPPAKDHDLEADHDHHVHDSGAPIAIPHSQSSRLHVDDWHHPSRAGSSNSRETAVCDEVQANPDLGGLQPSGSSILQGGFACCRC